MKPAAPIVIDFAPHRIRYSGCDGALLYVALMEYPLVFALDADGRIVSTSTADPGLEVEDAKSEVVWDGDTIAWRGRSITIAGNVRGGPARYDWQGGGIAHAGDDAFVLPAPSRLLVVPFEWVPDGRVDVRCVRPTVPEQPVEDAIVVFAGPERVLVQHERRGRFWLDVPKTGLAKDDHVRIGGFFSQAGAVYSTGEPRAWFAGTVPDAKIVATVFAFRDELVRLPAPPVPDESELVHVGDAGCPPPAKPLVPPKKLKELVATLVVHGLAPKQTPEQLVELAESSGMTEDDDIADHTAANVLATLHEEANTGLAHGFIALDVRWGNDTDDLVGDYANALGEDAKAIASVRAPDPEEGGDLDAFARRLNAMLEAAGAARRIYALETAGDWWAHIARTPEEVATMKKKGVRGIALP